MKQLISDMLFTISDWFQTTADKLFLLSIGLHKASDELHTIKDEYLKAMRGE
jgi:hypothetical protein